jgi:ADP-ribose pyrophosphatase YjhB (NUDIX family)
LSEVAISQDFVGAFGVLERDGRILLAGNRRSMQPGRKPELVFDLPGGRVEAGEMLPEALEREWREECAIEIEIERFLLVQEGLRYIDGERRYAWRSFFFAVRSDGIPQPAAEVESLLWAPRSKLPNILRAPYHQGFVRWLRDGEPFQSDAWR